MSRENVRVKRTRTLLRRALIELIEERGLDRVTVGEITERAMVSRAAFYRNYRDKYQLVEMIFDEAMADLLDAMGEEGDRTVLERWTGFFEHVDHYHQLYGALLGRRGSPWFAARMRASLAEMTAAHLSEEPDGLLPTLLGGMFVQAITWWLEADRQLAPAQIAARTAGYAATLIDRAQSQGKEPSAEPQ